MKNLFIVATALLIPLQAPAQKIVYKKDTVLINNKPKMLLEMRHLNTYLFKSLDNKEIVELHSAKIEQGHKPVYILTFLNDDKQAAIVKTTKNADCFVKYIYQSKIWNNNTTDTALEHKFLTAHPLPKAYTDVDRLIEY